MVKRCRAIVVVMVVGSLAFGASRVGGPQGERVVLDRAYRSVDARLAIPSAKIESGMLAATTGPATWDESRALRLPTLEEVQKAPPEIAAFLQRVFAAGPELTPSELESIGSKTAPNGVRVLAGTIGIDGNGFKVGHAFVRADLATIRARERDFVAYRRKFKKYSSIAIDAYRCDAAQRRASLRIHQVLAHDSGPISIAITVIERVAHPGPVVDYYLDCVHVRNGRGKDLYLPVADEHGLYGYLVVTIFGYEQEGLFRFRFDDEAVTNDIVENLGFLAEAGS